MDENYKQTKVYGTSNFFFFFTLWQLISMFGLGIIIGIFSFITKISLSDSTIQFVATIVCIWLPSILYVKKHNLDIKRTFKLNKVSLKNLGLSFLFYFCMLPLFELVVIISYYIFPDFSANLSASVNEMSYLSRLIQVVLMAGVGEELIFRGIFLDGYENCGSITKLILINGLLFGLFHANPYQFFYTFMLGCLFSFLCIYTNSIIPCILLHIFNNLRDFSLMELFESINLNPILPLLIFSIVGIVIFIILGKYFTTTNNNFAKQYNTKVEVCPFDAYFPIVMGVIIILVEIFMVYCKI